jgi:hypothetical protein
MDFCFGDTYQIVQNFWVAKSIIELCKAVEAEIHLEICL